MTTVAHSKEEYAHTEGITDVMYYLGIDISKILLSMV